MSYIDTDIELQEHLYSVAALSQYGKTNKEIRKILKDCEKKKADYFKFVCYEF